MIRALLADLDDTLFDHENSMRAALTELHAEEAVFQTWDFDTLEARHRETLDLIHLDVLAGRMTIDSARLERFRRLLEEAGDSQAADPAAVAGDTSRIALRYRSTYQASMRAVPGAIALASAARDAGIALIIVTNNITREQQHKIERCGLAPFVDALVTSEGVGVTKPDGRIFAAALEAGRARAESAVMLGDSWQTDIAGARAAGIRSVWLNRAGRGVAGAAPADGVHEIRALEPLADVWSVLVGQ